MVVCATGRVQRKWKINKRPPFRKTPSGKSREIGYSTSDRLARSSGGDQREVEKESVVNASAEGDEFFRGPFQISGREHEEEPF